MSEDYKRKNSENKTSNKKKTRTLVKLGGSSNERYDSYGHKIEKSKPPEFFTPSELPVKHQENLKTPAKKDSHEAISNRISGIQHEDAKQNHQKMREKPVKSEKHEKKLYSKDNIKEKEEGKKTAAEKNLPSHERHIAKRKIDRKKNIFAALKVSFFVLIIIVTIFLIFRKESEDEHTPRTSFISTGTIENSFNTEIHLIRDETAVTAGFSGKLIAAVNDGDRVAAGTTVAYIVKPEYEADLEQLQSIENKITAAQNAAEYVGGSQSSEVSALNSEILLIVNKLAMLSAENKNLAEYSELAAELEKLYELKNDILMNSESTDAYISSLKSERAVILARLESSMQEVKASEAGVVSFYTDSETAYASDKMQQITTYLSKKGESDNLLLESALKFAQTEISYKIGKDVSQGETVARITPDVTYYLTADITGTRNSGLKVGKNIIVKSSDRDFTVNATVEDLLQYGDRTYVLLKSSSGLAGTISKRIVPSELVVDYSEGIKVPKRALADWDSAGLTARLAIVRSGYVSYVYVKILAEDTEYAIVSNSNDFVSEDDEGITSVRINDLYVINYETVTEGQIIGA